METYIYGVPSQQPRKEADRLDNRCRQVREELVSRPQTMGLLFFLADMQSEGPQRPSDYKDD